MHVPEQARHFGLEMQNPEDPDQWVRLDSSELGGQWWDLSTTHPADVIERIEPAGLASWRAIWTPEDRRKRIGSSLPFGLDEARRDRDGEEDPAPSPPAPPPPPSSSVGQDQTPPAPPRPLRAFSTFARPSPPVAQPVAPPPPPPHQSTPSMDRHALAALDDSTRQLMYVHAILRQDADRMHQQTLAMAFAMVESERARSDNNVRMMKELFSHTEEARREHTAWVRDFADKKPSPELQQISQALGLLSQKMDELEVEEDETPEEALARVQQQNPSDMQQLMGLMASVVNSPIGAGLARKLFGDGGGAIPATNYEQAAAGQPPPEAAE